MIKEPAMIGIIGYGHVGKAMHALFPDAVLYDKYLGIGSISQINNCELSFVCVPTPAGKNGACDTRHVDEVLSWVASPTIVIRSTVPVGYTKEKSIQLGKRIVFQPEYYGETINHPLANLIDRKWIVLGGQPDDLAPVIREYQKVYTSEIRIVKTDSNTAELAKYMENAYLATKVVFCNEFYDIAQACNVDYDELREIWLMDPRINRSHTFVFPDDRGYGGSCFPKDMYAIRYIAEKKEVNCDLLSATIEKNEQYRTKKE